MPTEQARRANTPREMSWFRACLHIRKWTSWPRRIAASRDRLQAEVDISRYKGILDKPPMTDAEAKKNRDHLNGGNLGETNKAKLWETLPENRKQIEQRLKDWRTDIRRA